MRMIHHEGYFSHMYDCSFKPIPSAQYCLELLNVASHINHSTLILTIIFLTYQQFRGMRKMKYKRKLLLLQHIILCNVLVDNCRHGQNLLEMMQRKHVFQKVWGLTCGTSTWIKVWRSPKTHLLVKNLSQVLMVTGPQTLQCLAFFNLYQPTSQQDIHPML